MPVTLADTELEPICRSVVQEVEIAALREQIRLLDQTRIGPILCGEADVLHGGPPVTALMRRQSAWVSAGSSMATRGE